LSQKWPRIDQVRHMWSSVAPITRQTNPMEKNMSAW